MKEWLAWIKDPSDEVERGGRCDVCKRLPLSRQDNVEMCDVVCGSTGCGYGLRVAAE